MVPVAREDPVAQRAAMAAVTGPQQCVHDMRASYRARRDVALAVAQERSMGYVQPDGAFYLWLDMRATGVTSRELALGLLRHHRVAIAPGSAFGERGEGWVRLSLANTEASIRAGVTALADTVAALAT